MKAMSSTQKAPDFSKMSVEGVMNFFRGKLDEDLILAVKRCFDSLFSLYDAISGAGSDEFRMTDFFIPWRTTNEEKERREKILRLHRLMTELKKYYGTIETERRYGTLSEESMRVWRFAFEQNAYCTVEEAENKLREGGFDPHSEEDVRRLERLAAEVEELEKADPDCWMRTGGYFPLEPIIPDADEEVLKQLNIPRGYVVHDVLVSRIKAERHSKAGRKDEAKREREKEERLLRIYSAVVSRRKSPAEAVREVVEIKNMSVERMVDEAADVVAKEFLASIFKSVEDMKKDYPTYLSKVLATLYNMKRLNVKGSEKEVQKVMEGVTSLADLPISIGYLDPLNGKDELFYSVFIAPIQWAESFNKDITKVDFWRKVGAKAMKYLFGIEAEPLEPCELYELSANTAFELDRGETLEGLLKEYPELKRILKYAEEDLKMAADKEHDWDKIIGLKDKAALCVEILAKYVASSNPKEDDRLYCLEFRCFPDACAGTPPPVNLYPKSNIFFEKKCLIVENVDVRWGWNYDEEADVATLAYKVSSKKAQEGLNPATYFESYWHNKEKLLFFCTLDRKTLEVKSVEFKRVFFP